MKEIFKKYWSNSYSILEWQWMKYSLSFIWIASIAKILLLQQTISYPRSIWRWINHDWIQLPLVKVMIFIIAAFALWQYIREKRMKLSLTVIMLVSILVFSLSDSYGYFDRYDLMSCVWIAQWIAYVLLSPEKHDISQMRIQFSVQAVVGAYFLAGINKLVSSGWSWGLSTEAFALQVIKGNMVDYAQDGNVLDMYSATYLSKIVLDYPVLFSALLSLSLFLELACVVALFSKKRRIVFGLLFLCMHIGIAIFLKINLLSTVPIAMFFLLNPMYLLAEFLVNIRTQVLSRFIA